jgi:BCD family chlorophyll transporter-like MFS transporter
MKPLHTLRRVLGAICTALRLALPKLGVGWMFALLTSNFNQIAIVDLGVTAAIVTAMIGLHQFLSPFQVIFGRLADRHPLWGLRRTPPVLIGSLVASLIFPALPAIAVGMGRGSALATVAGFALLVVFGLGIAASGDAHHALIAEVTPERRRGGVISVVWTFTIVSGIASGIALRVLMPRYDPALMQTLYSVTPLIVMSTALLGLLGIERRLSAAELATAIARSRASVPPGNPIRAATTVLRRNTQARLFFGFVFLGILGIFIQDQILEVFGREELGMTLQQAQSMQPVWGGAVLLGMIGMGLLCTILPLGKKAIALTGAAGTALGLGLLTLTALLRQPALLTPTLVLMGLSTGLFNVGALSLMMDMTVEGATGLYMGLWGMAQAFGTGLAALVSGGLHTALIETQLVSLSAGYTIIFGLEAVTMVLSIAFLSVVSVAEFRGMTRAEMTRALELGAAS